MVWTGKHGSPWGRTLYVHSAHAYARDAGNDGLDADRPLATLKRAATYLQEQDRVFVGPTHVEQVDEGDDILLDTDDVQIIGVGRGLSRPAFEIMSTVSARVIVSGAGVLVENLRFFPGRDGLLIPFLVLGEDCVLRNLMASDTAAYQANWWLDISGDAKRCRIEGYRADLPNAGAQQAIITDSVEGLVIRGCHITGDFSNACIYQQLVSAHDLLIADNYLENFNAVDVCIYCNAASTGRIARNCCRIATDGETTWIDAAGCDLYENYGVNADGETGMLIGTPSA
jgi:hypothetical protein